MYEIYARNVELLAELRQINANTTRAREYANSVGSNPTLARASLDRLSVQKTNVLNQLRANRIRAQELIG